MKKKIQKINEGKKEQFFKSGEVMTMLEQMNDGIQIVAEQHGEIVSRLDNLDNKFDKMQGDVSKMQGDINKIQNTMDGMQDDVTEIKYKLSEKVDREEFEKMEKRVIKLEKLVFAKLT